MMLLCCSLASSSFNPRKSSLMSVDRLNSRLYCDRWFLLSLCHPASDSKNGLHKIFRVEIMAVPFVLFHRDRFFNFCCWFRQRFSAAYLLKLVFLPQCVHTTLFIRCSNLSLLAGVCAACKLVYRCVQMKRCAAVTVVTIASQKAPSFISSLECAHLFPRTCKPLFMFLHLTESFSAAPLRIVFLTLFLNVEWRSG